jgi:hypothetical protein
MISIVRLSSVRMPKHSEIYKPEKVGGGSSPSMRAVELHSPNSEPMSLRRSGRTQDLKVCSERWSPFGYSKTMPMIHARRRRLFHEISTCCGAPWL